MKMEEPTLNNNEVLKDIKVQEENRLSPKPASYAMAIYTVNPYNPLR